jgi:murein DD-endopeptidase MepM/ murein hydrolase activator NlpD
MNAQSELAPAERTTPATSGRWVVLWVLVALAFVSGVGASQDDRLRAFDSQENKIVFDPIPIDSLPLHADARTLPAVSSSGELAGNAPIGSTLRELGSFESDSLEPNSLEPNSLEIDESHGFAAHEPDAADLIVVTKGSLGTGQSLAGELGKRGIAPPVVHLVAEQIRAHFNFRHSQPGHRYRLALDSEGNVVDFRYSTSPEESIYLFWDGESYLVRREHAELRSRVLSLAGLVELSLYESIRALGEDPQLADDFAEIFAWDIDFTRNVKPGDAFRILYERLYLTDDDGEDIYVRPGRILAARYQGAIGEHSAVYFESGEGRGGYFRPNGTSVERAFLVAPLRYSRISSTFTNARRHPILKVTRRHPGIDYAAPEGTQLWAVADGTVIFRGYAGASGNLVKVRHTNGYVSQYAHLSRIADGLKVGQRVHQKEVIGYVGQTGLATGSHVCFRVTKNGRYVNPMTIRAPAAPDDLTGSVDFAVARDQLLAALDVRSIAAFDEAL